MCYLTHYLCVSENKGKEGESEGEDKEEEVEGFIFSTLKWVHNSLNMFIFSICFDNNYVVGIFKSHLLYMFDPLLVFGADNYNNSNGGNFVYKVVL